jgi:hypothetical protein
MGYESVRACGVAAGNRLSAAAAGFAEKKYNKKDKKHDLSYEKYHIPVAFQKSFCSVMHTLFHGAELHDTSCISYGLYFRR